MLIKQLIRKLNKHTGEQFHYRKMNQTISVINDSMRTIISTRTNEYMLFSKSYRANCWLGSYGIAYIFPRNQACGCGIVYNSNLNTFRRFNDSNQFNTFNEALNYYDTKHPGTINKVTVPHFYDGSCKPRYIYPHVSEIKPRIVEEE